MQAQATERRLAAIFVADVVGYSLLMSKREEATFANLRACLVIFHDSISNHGGRVFGGAGDSVVAEFSSAVEAVRAAVEIQCALEQRNDDVAEEDRMEFRIGISVGDVIVDGDNLMGDGVNIAARLESLAEPGGINITGHVYHQVLNKVEAGFKDAGQQALKNIPTPVQVYRVLTDSSAAPDTVPTPSAAAGPEGLPARRYILAASIAALAVIAVIWFAIQREPATPRGETAVVSSSAQQQSNIPTLAVLPFDNLSNDPEQAYFVDGITQDIIIDLSRLSNLTVIAWSTTSSYKGKKVPPPQVGKELGVTYVLDGSVRKSGDRLRITTELIETGSSKQVWAERYDRRLTEVFQMQDNVTQKIVAALAINLTETEAGLLDRATTATNNVAAYDALLRGLQYSKHRTREGYAQSLEAFRQAIELDPGYARAYGAMAIALLRLYRHGWSELTPAEVQARALELAQKAVALDQSSPQVYWALGYVHLFRKEYEEAAAAIEQAIALAPNYADAYGLMALVNNALGRAEDAIRNMQKAMVLNPYFTFQYPWNLGMAYYTLGRYEEAIEALQQALEHNKNALFPRLYLAACYIRLGRQEDARWEIEQVGITNPDMTVTYLANTLPYKHKSQLNAVLEDLRKAGLPE
jgi:adenylate cyclase